MNDKKKVENRKQILKSFGLSEQMLDALAVYPFFDELEKKPDIFLQNLETYKKELVPKIMTESQFDKFKHEVLLAKIERKHRKEVLAKIFSRTKVHFEVSKEFNISEIHEIISGDRKYRGNKEWYIRKLSSYPKGSAVEQKIGMLFDEHESLLLRRQKLLSQQLKHSGIISFLKKVAAFYCVRMFDSTTCELIVSMPDSESDGTKKGKRNVLTLIPKSLNKTEYKDTAAYDFGIILHECVHILDIEHNYDKSRVNPDLSIREAIVFSIAPGAAKEYCHNIVNDLSIFNEAQTDKKIAECKDNFKRQILIGQRLAGILMPLTIKYLQNGRKMDAEYLSFVVSERNKLRQKYGF
jgi:hypothetical protein